MEDLHGGALVDGLTALVANVEIAALVFRRSAPARTLAHAYDGSAQFLIHGDKTFVHADGSAVTRKTLGFTLIAVSAAEDFDQIASLNHEAT
jgi:hypothetical protein